jgi:hypothetical protein
MAWNRVARGKRSQGYTPLPLGEKEPLSPRKTRNTRWTRWSVVGLVLLVSGSLFAFYGLLRYKNAPLHSLYPKLTAQFAVGFD